MPALLSFCDLSFHTRYSEHDHDHDRDHQTNQISEWSGNDSYFSLNHYNMNGIINKGLTASKIIASRDTLTHELRCSSSCGLLQFFLLNFCSPLIGMLSNAICKSLVVEVESLHKALEPQWIRCLHGFD